MATTSSSLGEGSFPNRQAGRVHCINFSDSNEIGKLICSMEFGTWDESKKAGYNMVDAVSRSTVQVR